MLREIQICGCVFVSGTEFIVALWRSTVDECVGSFESLVSDLFSFVLLQIESAGLMHFNERSILLLEKY